MIPYVKSDGGRGAAGYKAHGGQGDCVIRAIAEVLGHDHYKEVRKAAREICGYKGWGTRKPDKLATRYGLVKVTLPKGPRPTFTEVARLYPDCVVSTTKHWTAIIEGALRDTFDCRTYEWEDDDGDIVTRERKAQSIWIPGVRS